jgi:hypothetical protein
MTNLRIKANLRIGSDLIILLPRLIIKITHDILAKENPIENGANTKNITLIGNFLARSNNFRGAISINFMLNYQ